MEDTQVRYYTDNGNKAGDIVSVYGWYDEQEWVNVELIKLTFLGWLVRRTFEEYKR